jgi:hypothetical protein
MHMPIRTLKTAAGPDTGILLEIFRKIFNLHDKSPVLLEAEAEPPEDLKKGQGN